jgi:hypothetical protein
MSILLLECAAFAVEDLGRKRGEKINYQLRDQRKKARPGPSWNLTQASEVFQTCANLEVATQKTSV